MESYCVFLMGAFIATPRFAENYGVYNAAEDKYFITAPWQSAFQCGGPVGALIGVFLAGPITSWIGYRWATIGGLMALNAFIFIFYFGDSLGVLLASQLLEGIPWGIFIANAPAYCSEIVPLRLRAPATQMLQMFWAIGAIIVGGITYHYQSYETDAAYRYVYSQKCRDIQRLTPELGSLLHSSGCSLLRWPSQCFWHQNHLGGLSERVAWRKLKSQSDVLDVRPQ